MPVTANRVVPVVRGLLVVALAVLVTALPLGAASAELILSQLIVELSPGARTADIEIFNGSTERSYVSLEPREVINPGTVHARDFRSPDPERLGLLVSPRRMILEANHRKRVRITAIGAESKVERVYRVTVRPVVGDLTGSESGLKLLVGYDLLILARPISPTPKIVASRDGRTITLTNVGNSSAELIDGKQCEPASKNCQSLPSKRLYSGASWKQTLPLPTTVQYRVRSSTGSSVLSF